MATKIIGQTLIELNQVMREQGKKPSEICIAAGYSTCEGANTKIDFTEFYTELLKAKGTIEATIEPETIELEEPELFQETVDNLLETYPASAIVAFIELYGESYLNDFESSYRGAYESGADFAQEMYNELHGDLPLWISVDWEDSWDNLRDEFSEEDGYIFCDNF